MGEIEGISLLQQFDGIEPSFERIMFSFLFDFYILDYGHMEGGRVVDFRID